MGGTWELDPDGFLLVRSRSHTFLYVFFFTGDVSLRTGPPPPLEWLPFPPLVAAVFITPRGVESPGSGCIGVIGAMVCFSICLGGRLGSTSLSLAGPVAH